MQVRILARRALRETLDFALPPRCIGCGTIVAEPHQFCMHCWQSIRWLRGPCCDRCGTPFEFEQGEGAECAACLADPPRCTRIRAAVAYGDVARNVVLKLKYAGKPGFAETMARFMERHMAEMGAEPLLAPVPLHRWRIWRRGYNQAALIATAISRRCDAQVALDLLQRTRRTPPLRGMGRNQRRRAVGGAFSVPEHRAGAVRGRNVLLIDDVYTSGATADACALALDRAGAAQVNLLCWARVVALDEGGAIGDRKPASFGS